MRGQIGRRFLGRIEARAGQTQSQGTARKHGDERPFAGGSPGGLPDEGTGKAVDSHRPGDACETEGARSAGPVPKGLLGLVVLGVGGGGGLDGVEVPGPLGEAQMVGLDGAGPGSARADGYVVEGD